MHIIPIVWASGSLRAAIIGNMEMSVPTAAPDCTLEAAESMPFAVGQPQSDQVQRRRYALENTAYAVAVASGLDSADT